jgi:MFS family permease
VISPYRRVLTLPGAFAFSVAAFVARMPISMVGLGIVLLVEGHSGSYALAGSVSAAYILANAVMAPVHGRLADRLGQHRVLPLAIGVYGAALATLILVVVTDAPTPVPHLTAAVVGAALPPLGSSVRARWTELLRGQPDLQTAYALEGVVDEAIFILGPVIVTLLATAVSPGAGLSAALVLGVGGTLALAAQRSTEPPVHRPDRRSGRGSALGWGLMAPLLAASFALGSLFGSAEVVTVAFADEAGRPAAAGPLLAVWALGSMLAGLITGALSWRASPLRRFKAGVLSLAVTMTPLALIDSVGLLAVGLFLAGFAISPSMIAAIAVVEETVPPSRLTEGIAWMTTGLAAGVAPGAALAGWVVDHSGASAGSLVAALSGYLATLLALACRPGRPADALEPVGSPIRSALRLPAVPAAPDGDHPPAEAGHRGRDRDQYQR